MDTKEYIVALKSGVDYDQFWKEMETSTVGLPAIPDRPVPIADNLDNLESICHYFLTDQEAESIRTDPRVVGVEIPAEHRKDIAIVSRTIQSNNFTKTNSSNGDFVNWGLIRNSNLFNIYGNSLQPPSNNYSYTLDGSNVDVLIMDSGLQADHPEFTYLSNNTSRVNRYKWTQNVNPATYYTDVEGHGTHVAGIAAGKTYGWAKNASIYFVNYGGIDFSGQTFNAMANVIIGWHNNKPINSATGVKNPTVINMSFGYLYYLTYAPAGSTPYNVGNVIWQGNAYVNSTYGNTNPYGLIFGQNLVPAWVETYNQAVNLMINAGIIVCVAAGNDSQKIDVPGGPDWNNTVTLKYVANNQPAGNVHYQRGSSPTSSTSVERGNAISVGALDSTVWTATLDKKAFYSQAGPGVDTFAAGSNIMSATSTINTQGSNGTIGGNAYYWNDSFLQLNTSGTSMSSPQIAGMAALYLQAHPTANASTVRSWITTNSTSTMIGGLSSNPSGTDYGNVVSQWGGNAGVAYQNIQGLSQIKTSSQTWKPVKSVSVKNDSGTWTEVKNIWVKEGDTWKPAYTDPS